MRSFGVALCDLGGSSLIIVDPPACAGRPRIVQSYRRSSLYSPSLWMASDTRLVQPGCREQGFSSSVTSCRATHEQTCLNSSLYRASYTARLNDTMPSILERRASFADVVITAVLKKAMSAAEIWQLALDPELEGRLWGGQALPAPFLSCHTQLNALAGKESNRRRKQESLEQPLQHCLEHATRIVIQSINP